MNPVKRLLTPTHLILYDGVCGLCNRFVRFVLNHDRAAVFRFASLQSQLGQSLIGSPNTLRTVYVVVNYGSKSPVVLSKSRAALFVLETLGGPWRLAAILGILPRRLLDWAYDLVARYRYSVFGRYQTCPLPSPEHRSRFIDL